MQRLSTRVPVRFLSYRFAHHAGPTGYDRICAYLGDVVQVPAAWERLGATLLRLPLRWAAKRSGNRFYRRSDLLLEMCAAREMRHGQGRLYHLVYGEKSFRHLGAWARGTGNAVVATFHNPPEQYGELFRSLDHLCTLDHATVVSRVQMPTVEQYVGVGRVSWVPYGVDSGYFAPGTRQQDRPKRCFFGGYHWRDYRMLEAVVNGVLKHEPGTEFWLVSNNAACRALADRPGVQWRERLSDEDYRTLLQQVDLLVLPLCFSTAVGTVLESLACGVPVITTLGGVADYLSPACAVQVPVGDAAGMVTAVLDLLRNEDKRQAMGDAARARALEFSWPRVAAMMAEVYDEIENRGSKRELLARARL